MPTDVAQTPGRPATAPGATTPDNFRDRIPTADARGKRVWIYPRRMVGSLYRARTYLSYLLLVLLFAGPFVHIQGNPLLMMNFIERRFSIFGQIFWPQDMFIFAVVVLVGLVMIVLFTAVYGRIWCGWLCPQTVLMEMVFRKIEYWIEGDAPQQRRLNASPWTAAKMARKAAKHAVFLAISFAIGNLLLAYIIGSDAWIVLISDNPLQHLRGLTAMVLFTLMFYGLFARFREQACTFICPYGRVQSVLLDDSSMVVAYDFRRGETRARAEVDATRDARQAAGSGDCVDCGLCVQVCPTGIDIRNGTQMECVNCTACIDACDSVMDRFSFPRGLIRFASHNNIVKGERFRISPRTAGYTVMLLALSGLLAWILASRSDIQATILRAPGMLYQTLPDGHLSNLYLIKVRNKTRADLPVDLRLESPAGALKVAGGGFMAKAQDVTECAAVVELAPAQVRGDKTPLRVGVYSGERRLEIVETAFLGPLKLP